MNYLNVTSHVLSYNHSPVIVIKQNSIVIILYFAHRFWNWYIL